MTEIIVKKATWYFLPCIAALYISLKCIHIGIVNLRNIGNSSYHIHWVKHVIIQS